MKKNHVLYSGLSLALLLFLSGCVSRTKSGEPTGFIWEFLGKPMAAAITFFATNLGMGFGLAIVLVTIIVRLLILPLGLQQSWKAAYHAEKTAYLKPILEPIQNRLKNATTQEEKLAAQTELFAAQKENGVSMLGGVGCLPVLIQMPFFSSLYFATQFTKGVDTSSFLGISLGHPSMILTAIIAGLYFIQSWLSMQSVPEEQKKQMKSMMYMMPLMMVFMSMNLPAGVGIYWLIGGFISILQQLITTYILKPKLRQKVAEEFEKNPPKFTNKRPIKDVSPKQMDQAISTNKKKTRRNAGKQNK